MVSLPFTSSHSSYDTAVFSTTPSSFHHVVASSVAIVTASQAMTSPRFTSTHSIPELTHTPSPSVHVLSSSVALVTSSKSTLSMHHTPTPQIAEPPHTFLSSQSSASSSVVMVTAFESRVASYSFSTQLVSKQSQIFPSSSSLVTVKASSTSPILTSLPTKLLNATEVPPTTEVYANNATQMVEIPAEKQKYKMILDGDCSKAMDNQRNFSQQFVKQLAKYFTVDKDKFEVEKVSCGSTIVDFTADISSNPNISMQLENMVEDGSFVFYYGGENFTMVDILTVTENPTPPVTDEPPTTPKAKSTKHGLTYDQQQFIIYVCLATVCGIAIIIAVAFCIQKYSKQCCRSRKKTFELVPEEHFVKLSDFNMAHTTIPRPKSIYEHNLDSNGKFKPYTNEEEEEHAADGNNGVAEHSCSVFTQTEGSLETVHIPQVMGSGQLSPDTKASQEFARNSVPVWDLPKLEGVVRQGEETESLTPVKRPSSGTFKEPITSPTIPSLPPPVPPPQPPPPPPPPAFMDPPTCSKSVQTGPVRTSDTFSELSDTSTVTDTRNLLQATKDGSPISAGVDNPAMIPDVDYVPRITPSDGLQ
ncbi:uncharacterized protein [Ptychodera flava]|uniref:uncharacterized protein n=1 Tax=Ptychodera flava TaxID=63121 RepID=UPI003969C682